MDNPENYNKTLCCYNCNIVEPYQASNRTQYTCKHRNGDDCDIDMLCGNHNSVLAPLKYQQVDCCTNCRFILKKIQTKNWISHECMIDAKTKDDGHEVEPDHKCDLHKKRKNDKIKNE